MTSKTVILMVFGCHFDLFLACSWVSKISRGDRKKNLNKFFCSTIEYYKTPRGIGLCPTPLLLLRWKMTDFWCFFFSIFYWFFVIYKWCFCINENLKITILGWVTKNPKKKKYTKTTQKSIRICLVHILRSVWVFLTWLLQILVIWISRKIDHQHSNWCPEKCHRSNLCNVTIFSAKIWQKKVSWPSGPCFLIDQLKKKKFFLFFFFFFFLPKKSGGPTSLSGGPPNWCT